MSNTPPSSPSDPSPLGPSGSGSDAANSAQPAFRFDPNAAHQQRPRLRPLRGFPVQGQTPDGQTVQMVGLVDARQVSEKMVAVPPQVQALLPLLDGAKSLDEIVSEVGRGLTRKILEDLVAQFDDAAFLEGPVFDALMEKTRAEFDASDNLPPASSVAFADALVNHAHGDKATDKLRAEEGARRIRETFDTWMSKSLEKVDNPSFDSLPAGIIVPHIDYARGWQNYASVYGRMRVCDRPARIVVLGTNHFGFGTGVVGCDKGFTTPLGTCETDPKLVEALRKRLGDGLFANRTDHEREHSIELQVPWIQHVFGKDESGAYPKVFGALVHDPAVNNGQPYDGKGVGLEPFVEALRESMSELEGTTLIVSSADLSHVGQAFGDQKPILGETPEAVSFRNGVLQHDMSMVQIVLDRKPADLISAMAWQQNPTRWCSTGNIVAALMVLKPQRMQMIGYQAAADPTGMAMVSMASIAMF